LLHWDQDLAEAARKHAALMAREGELSHQLSGEPDLTQRAGRAGASFRRAGENIAFGPHAQDIHTGWMNSPGHRANILNVEFTALGVGVVQDEDSGDLYAVEDFSLAVMNLSIKAQEEKVSELLTARGLRVTRDRSEARRYCADDRLAEQGWKMAILRYEAPDISKLPEQLEQAIQKTKYQTAAVGACKGKERDNEIALFRVAVLLY